MHTFFNVITLPEGDEEPALAAWNAVGEYMSKQPGFIGSTLYRNRQNSKIMINKGRYETEDSFVACVKDAEFQRLSQKLTDLGVERMAGLYEELVSFNDGG